MSRQDPFEVEGEKQEATRLAVDARVVDEEVARGILAQPSRKTGHEDWLARLSPGQLFVSRQRARHAGASNGSAKYWVSRATFPSRNSMMLTVGTGRPS
jgi:hypothetical protein